MNKNMLKINGIWVFNPAQFNFSVEDLDDTTLRTANGLLYRQRVAKKIKLSVSWNVIPESKEFFELVYLLDNLPEFFTMIFPHPNGNNQYSMTAYRGNPLSMSMRCFYQNSTGLVSLWKELKVNFIER